MEKKPLASRSTNARKALTPFRHVALENFELFSVDLDSHEPVIRRGPKDFNDLTRRETHGGLVIVLKRKHHQFASDLIRHTPCANHLQLSALAGELPLGKLLVF